MFLYHKGEVSCCKERFHASPSADSFPDFCCLDAEARRRRDTHGENAFSLWAASVGSAAAVDVPPQARRENTRAEIQEAHDPRPLVFPLLCSRALAAPRPTTSTAARVSVLRFSSRLRIFAPSFKHQSSGPTPRRSRATLRCLRPMCGSSRCRRATRTFRR